MAQIQSIVPVDAEGRELVNGTMQGFQGSAADVGSLALHAGTAGAVAREESEIKAAIVLARTSPRDEMESYRRILKACDRPSFADRALYCYPRGGANVEGPSVYLAREMARSWGNIRSGIRIVSMDREYVHVKGYAHDLETNSYKECESKFRALVQRKSKATGKTEWVQPDERDLRELVNKHGAICERNAILQTLPSDFTEDAGIRANETLTKASANELKANPAETVKRMVMGFDEYAVTPAMIEKLLGHELSSISAEELTKLRGIFASLKDGHTKREDHFEVAAPVANGASKTETLAAKLAGEKPAETPAPPASKSDAPPPQPTEQSGDDFLASMGQSQMGGKQTLDKNTKRNGKPPAL